MPFSSSDISAATYGFQQQSMGHMQYSGMISQFASTADPGQRASAFAGGAINHMAAIGAPVAGLGMALAGVDPMSMGIRGAMAGFGRAGIAGAVGGGMLGAGMVAAPLMAAQYAGGQMMQGMSEQQALYGQLGNGAFRHMNAYGGRGFSRSEMHDIGDNMRQMTQVRGPGGEFTSMDELGRLAANMGRMGMAQGVKNAKEFNSKFQEMMKSVKEIAESFSTSLEQAQQIMGSMRNSGIFGSGNQAKFAMGMRGAAVGGGVAMEEISQGANIGSQLSRMVGGRGRAGAVAGVRAVSTVGGALQAGVLSEEDLYNATGLTGAAGRQAMATNMLQGDAQFFKSSRGRQVLAAIAKEDGSIDMDAVRRIQSGETSVQETIGMRGDHLHGMSRANFIRNEGRLRGEAMGAFGGMGRVHAYRGWIKSKGYDVDSMDDKAMLAFQRFAGVDRDEADNLIKMARGIETIQDRQQDNMADDNLMRGVEERNKQVGIEGIKRKIEGAKQRMQGRLRDAGASILDSAENMVEKFFNSVTGEYTRRVEAGMGEALRLAHEGNATDIGFGSKFVSASSLGAASKVFDAKLAGGTDHGVPGGDFAALSERDRAVALSRYSLGTAGKPQPPPGMGTYSGSSDAAASMLSSFFTSQFGGGDDAKFGQYLESSKVLSANRRLLTATTDEQRQAAMAEQIQMRNDVFSDSNTSEVERQGSLRGMALSMLRAGKSEAEVMKATGFSKGEMGQLSKHEGAILATLTAQDTRKIKQSAKEYSDYYKDLRSTSLSDMDKRLYAGVTDKTRGAADKAHEFVGNFLLGQQADTKELDALANMADPTTGTPEQRQAELARRVTRMSELGLSAEKREEAARGRMEDMTDEELRLVSASGVAGVSQMASKERYQDSVLSRAGKSKRKGAGLQAIAQLLGGDLDSDLAKDLAGKSGDELLEAFSGGVGFDAKKLGEEDKKALLDSLSAAGRGDTSVADRNSKLFGNTAIREGIRESQREKQNEQAKESDPSFRKLENMDKTLASMLRVATHTAQLTSEQLTALKEGKDIP